MKGFTFSAINALNMKPLFLLLSILLFGPMSGQLRLPAIFSDHMVLQRDQPNHLWGWAGPGKEVQVDFLGKTYPAMANKNGQWSVYLEPIKAGVTGTITLRSGLESITLTDVIGGEVWVCSGQSNMEWRMDMLPKTYPDELKTAKNDLIRFTTVNKWLATSPVDDLEIEHKWAAISPSTVGQCSAVAYWFGKKIHQDLKVPVGLIVTAWGGTPAEAWTSFDGLYDFPNYLGIYREKISGMDLNELSNKKKALFQEFLEKIKSTGEITRLAMQPDFDDSKWETMELPRPWEELGYPALDGVVAYRISFMVSEEDAGKAAVLNTPGIDDIDSSYVNGVFVGSKNVWNQPRTYAIPAGVLKAGKNVLAVKVQDNQGGGGFAAVPDRFHVRIGEKIIPLAGKAKFSVIAELKDLTAGHGAIEHQPSVLYNAMIAPIMPLTFKGAIWYQGESNADSRDESIEYARLFPAMIRDWRNKAGRDFPFLFVQLASFGPIQNEPGESNWALLREAQLKTLQLPNTGMAIATDIGNPADIHPVRKKEVGERLAAEAMRTTYGLPKSVSTGPLFQKAVAEGNKMIVSFTQTGTGLMAKGGALKQFAVAGADKKFYWADAVIQGNKIVLSCKQVPKPVAVRYAWADSPVDANLYNKEGFPASPFRSDNW